MGEQPPEITDLVSALNRLSLAIESQQPRSSAQGPGEWEVVREVPEEGRQQQSSLQDLGSIAFGDYDSFAEQLGPCPEHLVTLCRRLRGGQYSSEYRAKRAWEIGFWAGLAYRNRIAKPRAGLPIDLKPTVYLVLKGKNITSPTRVSSASDLYRLTGRLDTDTLCQGFPSLAEAEVFCAAAGVALPDHHRWQ